MGFEPENALERSLVKAAKDPAHRPQFYKDLVRSDLFIIQHGEAPPERESRITLTEGKTLKIANVEWRGKLYVPIFSSLTRLQATITGEVAYLRINAKDLLEITLGSPLILNPESDYGKEISPEEAAAIVNGTIWQQGERYVTQKPIKVLIGQPNNYPHELVNSLARFFKTKRNVRRAWIAHFFNPDRDEKPHTLIAVQTNGGFDEVASEAGIVALNIEVPDPPVDFLPITGRGGIENYFLKEAKPFYQRKFLGLF